MIEGLQARLEKEEARVKTLTKRCHERSEETRTYKEELDSVADAIKEKDHQFETMEKEKANILLMKQQQASETDRSKKELKQEAHALEERNKKLQKALVTTLGKNKMTQKNDELKREMQSMEEQVEEAKKLRSFSF